MMREGIDKGIRRAVISLRRIAENARDRRKHDEAIEIHFPRRLVQQPCALRLGADHGSHALGGECGERRIVDHHREVKGTAQRLSAQLNLREQPFDVVRRTNVRRHHANLDAAFLQTGHELFGFRSGSAAAAGEDEMPRATIHEPSGQHFAIAAKCAGDQIASVRLDLESRRERFAAPRNEGGSKCHNHFADVFSASHKPKRRIDSARRKSAKRQRPERALLDQVADLLEHLAGKRFVTVKNRVHRHDVERGIAPQWPKRNAGVLVDVSLADFDETTELRQTRRVPSGSPRPRAH